MRYNSQQHCGLQCFAILLANSFLLERIGLFLLSVSKWGFTLVFERIQTVEVKYAVNRMHFRGCTEIAIVYLFSTFNAELYYLTRKLYNRNQIPLFIY